MIGLSELKVFEKSGCTICNIIDDKESAAYNACSFTLNAVKALYRSAKITPTKNGQFVTVWKRIGNGPIQPFDDSDALDILIVSAEKDAQSGYFIFPKAVLCKQKIFTNNGKEGKRAFRVYPPWDIAGSKQAASTQKWQLDYFLESKNDVFTDMQKAALLLSVNL